MPGISVDLLDCKERETNTFYFLILQALNINITFQYFVRGENGDIFYEKPKYTAYNMVDSGHWTIDKVVGRVMLVDP